MSIFDVDNLLTIDNLKECGFKSIIQDPNNNIIEMVKHIRPLKMSYDEACISIYISLNREIDNIIVTIKNQYECHSKFYTTDNIFGLNIIIQYSKEELLKGVRQFAPYTPDFKWD